MAHADPARPAPTAPTLRPADFAAALRAPARARTLHFALHHAELGAGLLTGSPPEELSTDPVETKVQPVEDLLRGGRGQLGTVVPKRLARRAVTRSLLKRQIREAARRHAAGFADGLWIVRLRAPFERSHFASAASSALKRAARAELEALLTAPRRDDR